MAKRGRPPWFDQDGIDTLCRWIYRWRFTSRDIVTRILGVARLQAYHKKRIKPFVVSQRISGGWTIYYLSQGAARSYARQLVPNPLSYRLDPLRITTQQLDHEIGIQRILFDHYFDRGALDALPPRYFNRVLKTARVPDAYLPDQQLAVEFERSDKGSARCWKMWQQCHHTMGSTPVKQWLWHFERPIVRARYISRYNQTPWPEYRPKKGGSNWTAVLDGNGTPKLVAPAPRIRDRIQFL